MKTDLIQFRRSELVLCLSATLAIGSCAITDRAAQEPLDLESERVGTALYEHEDMYIVIGEKNTASGGSAKFQLSGKIRLFNRIFGAYSQTNVSKLEGESSPFLDVSYRPALFYYGVKKNSQNPWWHHAGGWEHNSNGKDGVDSRSFDTVFYQLSWYSGSEQSRHWKLSAKLFSYFQKGENTEDIDDYRSTAALGVRWGQSDSVLLTTDWQPGKSGRGSGTLGLSYPVSKVSFSGRRWNIPGKWYVQVFSGHGETLLDYQKASKPIVRIGYSLVHF